MLIVDTGVWVDYFNGRANVQTDYLDYALQYEKIALTDVILMEILQGFRKNKAYHEARSLLLELACFDILGKNNAVRYADYYRQLRQKGLTIRKSNDVMIAGFCIDHQFPLLFQDKDFIPFTTHLGLLSALTAHTN
ncbi:type II toxin-antitoxin system VapC family toxin [Neisseria chenwenguii]|uniref:VapC toxin family PIN domain ribonuclease n=1 Tax=Neisseria chenwenguii TaxID=1853278 RepID=A0A220S305_9NEIS|nr:PIN domain nuclease [Neisseria chenwenguii]ASK27822.1 VapC toxin family PIN domain ribonuclease [Neisseria chenwenguii]ROV56615.1 PIN domain nuclease [Neisseria chenwenguii]